VSANLQELCPANFSRQLLGLGLTFKGFTRQACLRAKTQRVKYLDAKTGLVNPMTSQREIIAVAVAGGPTSIKGMMRTIRTTGTMSRPQPRIAMNRHHRPALMYRRQHRIWQREQMRRELDLLRGVVAALRELGLEGTGRLSTQERPDCKPYV
jgi:hypothetical protein